MASDVRVSLVSSSIRFIITCHQSPRLSISLSAPSVPLPLPSFFFFFFLLPPSSCFLFNPDGLIRHRLQTPRGCLTPRRHFFFLFLLFLSLVLKHRSVSHLSPSLISLREPALTHSCTHTLDHSLDSQTNTNTHTHTHAHSKGAVKSNGV